MRWRNVFGLTAVLLAACGTAPQTSAPEQHFTPGANAMALLPGLWQAEISNNAYQMRVIWNASTARFEGRLASQGYVSQYVGFSLGELVWVATPTQDPNILVENQEWRYGMHGMSMSSTWKGGTVDLRASGWNELVSSFARFRKVSN